MSIIKKTAEQITALTATLKANPHITQVHFDKEGRHFFNVHEHAGKKYSKVDQERTITGYRGQEAIVKTVGKVKPECEITESLHREQVLSYEADMTKESKASSKKQ